MPLTRYREARTLVRRLTRLPGEAPQIFRQKVRTLRLHFQDFNRDAALVCQWLMALRPPAPEPEPGARQGTSRRKFDLTEATGAFWRFVLAPDEYFPQVPAATDRERANRADKLRLAAVNIVLDLAAKAEPDLAAFTDQPVLLESIHAAAAHPRSTHPEGVRLFARLRPLADSHREVLLKAAAEWVHARYKRPMDKWPDQRRHWQEEKDKWLKENPALTPAVCDAFGALFHKIGADKPDEPMPKPAALGWNSALSAIAAQIAPERSEQDKKVIRSKRPRICTLLRMKGGLNNCMHNGQRCGAIRHGPLCVKYFDQFEKYLKTKPAVREAKDEKKAGEAFGKLKQEFAKLAAEYLRVRQASPTREEAMKRLKSEARVSVARRAAKGKQDRPLPADQAVRAKQAKLNEFDQAWFFDADWPKYLECLGITEETALRDFKNNNGLFHCIERGKDTSAVCRFNNHTELCLAYRRASADLPDKLRESMLPLEDAYREWRGSYMGGPKRPGFNYPSAKLLPMPKIFGAGHWQADFAVSRVKLKMETGDELEFGFTPWPKQYQPDPRANAGIVTSVHVHFVGTRPRLGFRFDAPHKPSRVAVAQDDIDKIRSQDFPRAHQDMQYLQAACKRVLDAFPGGAAAARQELRVLSVDLGSARAAWALLVGRQYKGQPCGGINIVKIEDLKPDWPQIEDPDGSKRSDYSRGLNKEHVVRHQKRASLGAMRIAEARNNLHGEGSDLAKVGEHDQRGLFRHVRWMVRDWVRLNASQIIKLAETHKADVILLDSSRKPMVPAYDDQNLPEKQRKAYRAFGQIRHKLREKAVERGMRVVMVPEGNTSSACHACGELSKQATHAKKARLFACKNEKCEISKRNDVDCDVNAALVMGRLFWGEIDLEKAAADVETRKAEAKARKQAQGDKPHGNRQRS